MTLELHPLCASFPRLKGREFASFCEDIRTNGLKNPIVTYQNMILDGGNRYKACIEVGVKAKFIEFDGDNPASFVLSSNLHRRHLSPGQQAAIVASVQDWSLAHGRGSDGSNQYLEQTGTLPVCKQLLIGLLNLARAIKRNAWLIS